MFLPANPTFDPGLASRVRREMPKPQWYIGLDLGQRRDYSALACMEITWRNDGRCPVTYEWRFTPTLNLLALDRFPLGTDYEEIPRMLHRRVDQINSLPCAFTHANPAKHVIIDGGGPGPPVIDRIRRSMSGLVNVRPVIITAGKGQSTLTGGYTGVPRRSLISNVLLLMSNRTLQMPPDLHNRELLETEFANLAGGSTQPATADAHDDLVIAVCLGAWAALRDAPELLPDRPVTRYEVWDAIRESRPDPPKPPAPKPRTKKKRAGK